MCTHVNLHIYCCELSRMYCISKGLLIIKKTKLKWCVKINWIQWLQWGKQVLGGLSCSPVKRVEVGTHLAPVLIPNIYSLEVIQGNWNSEKVRITLHLPFCPIFQVRNLAFSPKVSLHRAWALDYISSLNSHQTKKQKPNTKYIPKLKSTHKSMHQYSVSCNGLPIMGKLTPAEVSTW